MPLPPSLTPWQTADPQTPPDSSPDPELASPPGWGPPPIPPAGPRNPDQPSPDTGEAAAGASDSPDPLRPTPKWSKGKADAYTAIARALFTALGGYVNMVAAVDEDDTAWLPDDDDSAAVPPPLGRLAARRIPLGDLGESYTDLQDIGEALVGLVAYVAKGITATLNARRARKQATAGSTLAPDLPPGDQ